MKSVYEVRYFSMLTTPPSEYVNTGRSRPQRVPAIHSPEVEDSIELDRCGDAYSVTIDVPEVGKTAKARGLGRSLRQFPARIEILGVVLERLGIAPTGEWEMFADEYGATYRRIS